MKWALFALAFVPFSAAQGGLAALQADVTQLSQALAAANNSLAAFTGGTLAGIVGLAKVSDGVAQVNEAIDKTIADAKATNPRLSFADSVTIGVQFIGVAPQINQLVETLISKRPEFDKAGFGILDVTSLIRDVLTSQKAKATELGTVFVNALDPALGSIAGPLVAQIDAKFSAAVAAFEGRGGLIRIPPELVPKLTEVLTQLARALGIHARSTATINAVVRAVDVSGRDLSSLGEWENDWSDVPAAVRETLNLYGIN